ncbi:MAG: endolytic transglycosylase MltG [Bacteroidota bacterium]
MFKKYRFVFYILIAIVLVGVVMSYRYYNFIFGSNVKINQESTFLYIPTGSDFDDVVSIIEKDNILKDIESFKWLAEKKNYIKKVKAGKYKIKNNWSNNDLIRLLRSGDQTPVKITYSNVRFLSDLAGVLSHNIEPDSIAFKNAFSNPEVFSKYGFNKQNFISMFIPNTYEFFWNTSVEDFIERINKEYKKFWNETRNEKLKKTGLTEVEVSTIASIVEMETIKVDEMPIVAGVYINRYRKGMKLEADPTLKFAVGDFTIKRVLNIHKEVNSPYNTYMYAGLPPGPICLPSVQAIEAVLNYEKHDYLFFCAKPDFSGYHSFAKTNAQHQVNAKLYWNELNKRNIK